MSFSKALGDALRRSADVMKQETSKVLRMDVNRPVPSTHMTLLQFRSPDDLQQFATGSDKDIGGYSTVNLSLDKEEGKGRFWGTVSSELPRDARIERSGYAGFRSKSRPTLFGTQTWDTSPYRYLALRVRDRSATGGSGGRTGSVSSFASPYPTAPASSSVAAAARAKFKGGEEGPKFFVNIQTDGPVTSDLYQHRLHLRGTGDWETVLLPFSDFVLTNTGQVSPTQPEMMRDKVRTVGVSVVVDSPFSDVGGARGGPGASVDRELRGPESGSMGSEGVPETGDGGRASVYEEEDDWAKDGDLRSGAGQTESATRAGAGSRRGKTFKYDLGIEWVRAVRGMEEVEGS